MSRRFPDSIVDEHHPDFPTLSIIREKINSCAGGPEKLGAELPTLLKDAVDFVLDPAKTGRTSIDELDKVEKTFIGLKVEHFLRDMLGLPKGKRRDVRFDDLDVDIKNTIGTTWMIPLETYSTSEPCLLIATAKFDGRCWLGLMLARESYLGAKNRDQKRSVTAEGKRNILWLVEDKPYPPSRWEGIDMVRFRELRNIKGGNKRAAIFFQQNLGRIVHRSVLQALLHDQLDFTRRLRGDKKHIGAREILQRQQIVLLCGTWDEESGMAAKAGFPSLSKDEWLALQSNNS
jgi:Restriction endonuclease NaeI